MLKYDVECDASLDELMKLVNKRINRGWQLIGGIATMTHQPRYTVFYQAMTKEVKTKEKIEKTEE